MSFRNAFMTGAEGAKTFAEGKVDVETYFLGRISMRKSTLNGTYPAFRRKAPEVPVGYRRIAGVPRSGHIVFSDQGIIHVHLFCRKATAALHVEDDICHEPVISPGNRRNEEVQAGRRTAYKAAGAGSPAYPPAQSIFSVKICNI